MRKPDTVKALEAFGRERLSKSFYMRDFLYSDIAQIHSIPNIPDDPDLALAAGRRLCQELLEPLWQRVADGTLRSVSVGYRVHRYETVTDPRDGTVHRAVDWEPYEISVVPIPVDPAA
jgi:hypothetical protein